MQKIKRQVILDTETTGLDPSKGHRLTEIGCLEMIDRRLTGRKFHTYLNPQREVEKTAAAITGLTTEFLRDKPKFSYAVAEELVAFLKEGDTELIIHNAPFDVGFLNHEFKSVGLPDIETLTHSVTDTLPMARKAFPGKRANLDALCDRFGIDRSNRTLHGALVDCELLAEVYLALTRGQHSLDMGEQSSTSDTPVVTSDRPKNLVVLKASEEELKAHNEYISELDKASGSLSLYHQLIKNMEDANP